MRYIEKVAIEEMDKNPNLTPLLAYINEERNPIHTNKDKSLGLPPPNPLHPAFAKMKSHDHKKAYKALTQQLLKENYGLCTFCEQRVSTNRLIEHFVPQSKFKNEEVDYYNLFLCCDTQSQCSDAKKEMLIGKFVTHPECPQFFQYNWNGEILPKISQSILWDEIDLNTLQPMQQQAYSAIKILNLNKPSLVYRREQHLKANDFEGELIKNKRDVKWLKNKKKEYIPQNPTTMKLLPEFASMFLYFINEVIINNHGKDHV